MQRTSGILMPVSALPSPYGIGAFGRAAHDFARFLRDAGQRYWQILPLGPTGYGDSPYQSFSSHAGNPYFVDLDLLRDDGLLTVAEIETVNWGDDPGLVDYGALYAHRFDLLGKAKERGWSRDREAVSAFEAENSRWLPDYALFMALKRHFGMKPWTEWPDEGARLHRPEALAEYRASLREDVELFTYIQFLFFRQWHALRRKVNALGIRIIGDLPIYVALDSADVWAEREWFLLDEAGHPIGVAGVPPDSFTADGQLWGNPLYHYAAMRNDGYGWWIRRVGSAERLYDIIRIDHFRGFESYWVVPYGETSAKNGHWVKGPGMDLVGRLTGWFPRLPMVAENLGYITPEVEALLRDSRLPGMKILEFAFDSRDSGGSLPHTYPAHSVCYTGTHDNAPLAAWFEDAAPADVELARRYFGLNRDEGLAAGMLRGGMACPSDVFIAQMQDWLGLGREARMNVPGAASGNWRWRMLPEALTPALAERIAAMTALFGRSAVA